jgi:hypothetical protein
MLGGVVGFTAVVLMVLALSARRSPVPAGVEGVDIALPGSGIRPARLPPSRLQAALTFAGYSLMISALPGSLWLANSTPDSLVAATANHAATRELHAVVSLLVLVVAIAEALLLVAFSMGFRANRGRERARGFVRPGSLLGDAYRALGRTTAVTVVGATSLYGLAVFLVLHRVAS